MMVIILVIVSLDNYIFVLEGGAFWETSRDDIFVEVGIASRVFLGKTSPVLENLTFSTKTKFNETLLQRLRKEPRTESAPSAQLRPDGLFPADGDRRRPWRLACSKINEK